MPLITLLQLLLVSSVFAIPPGLGLQSRSGSPLSSQSDSTSPNVYSTRFPNVIWNNDEWQLSTTNLNQGIYQSRMSVANGYIGINVAALGPFFEVETPVMAISSTTGHCSKDGRPSQLLEASSAPKVEVISVACRIGVP